MRYSAILCLAMLKSNRREHFI